MKHAALAAILMLSACATAQLPAEPAKAPLVREAGKPLIVPILAARYTLDHRIDVDDHRDTPGSFTFSFVDRVTRCEGYFLFETVSRPEPHEQYVKEKREALLADWQSLGLEVSEKLEEVELLGQKGRGKLEDFELQGHKGRAIVFDIRGSDGMVRAALVDIHVSEQNLSIVNYTFCADPGLMKGQLEAIVEVINSQRQ